MVATDGLLTIGRLAKLTGVPAKTIRYYEDVGVLPPPARTDTRYRCYSEVDVRRLQLVRRAKLLDIPLSEIRELVEWADTRSCDDFQQRFHEAVQRKMEHVDETIAELHKLQDDLVHIEAHLTVPPMQGEHDHPMVACSPETCTCLGNSPDQASA